MRLVSVAAVAENGVIGNDGEVPWPHLPADVEQYRERVADSPVILGRKTFESMREDLPGSRQIVVSRSADAVDDPTALVAGGVEAALDAARRLVGAGAGTGSETDRGPDGSVDADSHVEPQADSHADAVYVLGGGAIYALFHPHIDGMAISHVDGAYDGDTRFPEFDESEWEVIDETDYEGFTLREWSRRNDGR